jgi:hypothetical protein
VAPFSTEVGFSLPFGYGTYWRLFLYKIPFHTVTFGFETRDILTKRPALGGAYHIITSLLQFFTVNIRLLHINIETEIEYCLSSIALLEATCRQVKWARGGFPTRSNSTS